MSIKLPSAIGGTYYAGDTIAMEFDIAEGTNPFNLTGWAITFTAKLKAGDADNAFGTIQKTIGAGIVVVSAALGQITVTLDPADTSDLRAETTFVFDIQVSLSGEVITVTDGTITITPDITQKAT